MEVLLACHMVVPHRKTMEATKNESADVLVGFVVRRFYPR
jgi:hypothetical protein